VRWNALPDKLLFESPPATSCFAPPNPQKVCPPSLDREKRSLPPFPSGLRDHHFLEERPSIFPPFPSYLKGKPSDARIRGVVAVQFRLRCPFSPLSDQAGSQGRRVRLTLQEICVQGLGCPLLPKSCPIAWWHFVKSYSLRSSRFKRHVLLPTVTFVRLRLGLN